MPYSSASPLKAELWRSYLQGYWDQQLVDLIQYGFPLDFKRNCPLQSTMQNHASAIKYVIDVEKYLSTELQHEAIIDPFDKPPFPMHILPLMTRPKEDLT